MTEPARDIVIIEHQDQISTIEVDQSLVTVETEQFVTVVEQDVFEVVVAFPGPQGPAGPPGSGGGSGVHYQHTQSTPSTTWFVSHNLGIYPNVAVLVGNVDVSDGVIVTHTDVNNLTVTSSVAISGTAECS